MLASSSGNFLVPDATFIAEFIAFLIILAVIARWILPPLNRAMQARQQEIKGSLEAAETARAEAAEADTRRQETLDEARREAREVITQANKSAERIAAQAEERGRQEYDRLVGAAEAEIRAARQRAVDEVSAKVSGLVMSVARQVVGREVDAQTHRALIDEAVAALRASEAGSTPAGGSAGAPS